MPKRRTLKKLRGGADTEKNVINALNNENPT